MKRTTLYTLSMAAMLLSCVCFLGCTSRVQPSGTGDVACTCAIGNPQLDWIEDRDVLSASEDCPIHHAVNE